MGTPKAHAQILDGAELELLDGSFGTAEFGGDLADAAAVYKTLEDDAALVGRKRLDELKERGALFHFGEGGLVLGITAGVDLFFRGGVPAVNDGVGGHTVEPRDEGNAAPLKAWEVGKRLMKHFGRQIFRLFAVADTARDEGVDTIEVLLVELGEAARIALGGLNEKPFGGDLLVRFGSWLPARHVLTGITCAGAEKLRWRQVLGAKDVPHEIG